MIAQNPTNILGHYKNTFERKWVKNNPKFKGKGIGCQRFSK